MSHVTAWGWFWLAWIFSGLAVELYWVFVKAANTLSRQIWAVERLNFAHPFEFSDWTWLHWTISLGTLGLFAWLTVHFAFGWLR